MERHEEEGDGVTADVLYYRGEAVRVHTRYVCRCQRTEEDMEWAMVENLEGRELRPVPFDELREREE